MDGLISDLRYALKGLIRAPKIIGLAVLSLALGVAVNTTMFTALDAFLLRPLPYDNSERIVRLWLQDLSRDGERLDLTAADYENFRERSRTVELAAAVGVGMNVTSAEEPMRAGGVQISDNLLHV